MCLEHSCALCCRDTERHCCLPEVTNTWPSEGLEEEKSDSKRKRFAKLLVDAALTKLSPALVLGLTHFQLIAL